MISTKGRYALRVMIDLAEHQDEGRIPLKDIADRQAISKKYLEIIVRDLVAGGFVTGYSGKGGGYRLNRDPEDCTVAEILEQMEGTLAPVACLQCNAGPCPRADFCPTLPMWKDFQTMVTAWFQSKTLSDLISRKHTNI